MGERCVERLNGMFAFVIWDARARRLFAARDRIGIKPFVYTVDKNRFLCASQTKALLEDPSVPRAANYPAIADYLFAGGHLGDQTPFAGVTELPPGFRLVVANGTVRTERYWDVKYTYQDRRPRTEVVDQLSALVDDAVRIHCRSDAPLGCHLSGGIDSSIVTCLAARHRPPFPTFSIRFAEGNYFDETYYARAVASMVDAQVQGNDAAFYRLRTAAARTGVAHGCADADVRGVLVLHRFAARLRARDRVAHGAWRG